MPRLERLLHWVTVGNTAVGELRDAQLAARAAGQRRWCDRVAIHSRTLLHPGRATRRHPAARLLRIGDPQAISNPKWLFPETRASRRKSATIASSAFGEIGGAHD